MNVKLIEGSAMANDDGAGADYRSGTAARLAGLPVETLRVWERRYGICATVRSVRGQRLYSAAQVRRLAVIKQLVDLGQPIGSLAGLADAQLHALLPPASLAATARPVRVALVGDTLVRRLAASGRELFTLDIVGACAGLDDSSHLGAAAAAGTEVLLIEVSELSEAVLAPIAALRAQFGAAAVVLYRFGASAVLARLRAAGCLVAQATAELAELVLLCEAARASAAHGAVAERAPSPAALPITPPRFDAAALAAWSTMSGTLACECPRHLASLLLTLTSFERYSLDCASASPDDGAVHQDLARTAGQARLLLEGALERLAQADGLALPARA